MAASLYRILFANGFWHPSCMCGWRGMAASSSMKAREMHTDHMDEDCPIGKR